MAGKGGGAWKVAYADFVTAMMAFFMVMWLTSQSKPVRQAIAEHFRDPYGSKNGVKPVSQRGPEGASTIGAMKSGRGPGRGLAKAGVKSTNPKGKEIAAGKPNIFVLHNGDQARTGTLIVFAEDSAELTDEGRERLNEIVPLLLGKPNKIEIRGHASRRPLPEGSPFKDAWQLSYARSLEVMKYLAEKGVESERVRLSQAGMYEPYTLRSDADRQKQNARVEVYALSEYVHEYSGTREEREERFDEPEVQPSEEPLAAAVHH